MAEIKLEAYTEKGYITLQDILVMETEKEFQFPELMKIHNDNIKFLLDHGVVVHGSQHFSDYYNRCETLFEPAITWNVGKSVLKVRLVLTTEFEEETDFNARWKRLGDPYLHTAEPLVRILAQSFHQFLTAAKETHFKEEYYYWIFIQPRAGGRRFLRVYLSETTLTNPEIQIPKRVVSYLRFYKDDGLSVTLPKLVESSSAL